mgnify:CR=1 FL=1
MILEIEVPVNFFFHFSDQETIATVISSEDINSGTISVVSTQN